jgi:hypothetical protein
MPYVVQSDLAADIPPDFLLQALDDDGDGVQDAGLWDLIAQQVSDAIDGQIGVRYLVPLAPNIGLYPYTYGFPPIVANAARVLASEKLYGRRAVAGQANPWTSRANLIRGMLDKIAAGSMPLDPADNRKDPSASVITEPMQSVGGGRLTV